MSLKKQLFIALTEYLQEQLQAATPPVAWIDKDLGQFELMQDGVVVLPLPAILVSFPDANFESLLGSDQTSEIALRLRIGFENYYDAQTGDPNRELALQFFDFNEAVHNAVMGFGMEGISGIRRVTETEDLNHNQVIVTEIIYTLVGYNAAQDSNTYTSSTPHPRIAASPPEPPTIDGGYIIPGK